MKIHRTKVHRRGADKESEGDGGDPAYKDQAALQEAYDTCDSFPEMREQLSVDVSAQTVRRHMIDHGIHDPDADPATTGTAGEDADETASEQAQDTTSALADLLPDDVAAPDDLTLDEVKAGVEDAETLYDFQQAFDMNRGHARDLLAALDLLELVHGRVATKPEREELKTEIDRRIEHSIDHRESSASS